MKRTPFWKASLLALCLTSPAFAGIENCTEPLFAEISNIGNFVYRFPISVTCDVTEVDASKFMDLFTKFEGIATNSAETIHAVVGSEAFKKYDLTKFFENDEGKIKSRNDVTIKTDKATQFDQWDLTKEIIFASGNMQFTKRAFTITNVKLAQDSTSKINVRLTQVIDIQKPGIAPIDVFMEQAKKGLIKSTKALSSFTTALIETTMKVN